MKKLKPIPSHKNEDAERQFWATHASTDYIDWSKGAPVKLPNLKPTTKLISIRLPLILIDELKTIANRQDLPYQSLIKSYLAQKIDAEYQHLNKKPGKHKPR